MKYLPLTIVIIAYASTVYAQTSPLQLYPEDPVVLSQKLLEQLEGNNNVIIRESNWRDLGEFTPRHSDIQEHVETIREEKPRIVTEALMYIPDVDPEAILRKSYELLTQPSLLAGLQYVKPYRDNAIATLFETSYRIDNLSFRNKIEDKPEDVVETLQLFMEQDIPPFGNAASSINIKAKPGYIHFQAINRDPLKYKGVAIAREGKMITNLEIIRYGTGVIIYGVGGVRTTGITVFAPKRLENSFGSRTRGLFNWFYTQITSYEN